MSGGPSQPKWHVGSTSFRSAPTPACNGAPREAYSTLCLTSVSSTEYLSVLASVRAALRHLCSWSSSSPSPSRGKGVLFPCVTLIRISSFLYRSERRLLLPPLLCPPLSLGLVAFHLHFYDLVFSSSVLNRFGLIRSLDLYTSMFQRLLLPFLCCIFL
jgi:hypothetical protein